jgi:fumarylacetoacetase-like protein
MLFETAEGTLLDHGQAWNGRAAAEAVTSHGDPERLPRAAPPTAPTSSTDILGSGTCGNGGCLAELWGRAGSQEPRPLQAGDVVTMTVEGIGTIRNTVVASNDLSYAPQPARTRSRQRR